MAPPSWDDDFSPRSTATSATALPNATTARRPIVAWEDEGGQAHERVVDERVTVGAAPGVGIQLAQPTVSRLHAELDPRDDGLWIRDLGSKNGTFIGDVQVSEARMPFAGGVVRLGDGRLRVRWPDEETLVELWPHDRFGDLVGQSVAMRSAFARLARFAESNGSVLIQGETGTGKELVARALHEASLRAKGPFVVVDCGAIPESLVESELFGHARGAFTGAVAPRVGAFEEAHGGTVFLDEIGELPLSVQPKLLRVLESRTVRRVGESQYFSVDVRFLAATHRDLRKMVNAGAFREDLYFRLSVLPVTIPPLRERRDDIPHLVDHFLETAGAGLRLDEGFVRELQARPWLGNVRELRNVVERAMALGAEEALRQLPGSPLTPGAGAATGAGGPAAGGVPLDLPYKDAREKWLERLEREYVAGLLARYQRNVPQLAQHAGVDRTYVYRLIRKHGL